MEESYCTKLDREFDLAQVIDALVERGAQLDDVTWRMHGNFISYLSAVRNYIEWTPDPESGRLTQPVFLSRRVVRDDSQPAAPTAKELVFFADWAPSK